MGISHRSVHEMLLGKNFITVRLLEQGTWKNSIESQRFIGNKRFSSFFFANGTIRFKVQQCNR